MVDIDKTKQSGETERYIGILETKLATAETNATNLASLITALTARVATLEGYFASGVTTNTRFASDNDTTYVGHKLTITKGLITAV